MDKKVVVLSGFLMVALVGVVIIGTAYTGQYADEDDSTTELAENPYGAYTTNFESKDPFSLGFNFNSYANNNNNNNNQLQQQPANSQQLEYIPRPRMQRRRMTPEEEMQNLEKRDESLMQQEELSKADRAAIAIRSDVERAKLLSLRKQHTFPHYASSDDSSSLSSSSESSAAQANYIATQRQLAARRALARKLNDKQMRKTLLDLESAVGSGPSDGQSHHDRYSRVRVAGFKEVGDDSDELFATPQQQQQQSQQQQSHLQQQQRQKAAAVNSADELRYHAALRRERIRNERKQSLSALARETGEEAADIKSQWSDFTTELGVNNKKPKISNQAESLVDTMIGNDLT